MAIVGGHVSAAGGVSKAVERAADLGFAALQIHPSSPQTWNKPTVTPEEAAAFVASAQEKQIAASFFHNIYLTNFASESPGGWHGSIEISKSYMQLAAQMQVVGTVTHLGSHKGAGMAAVLDRLVEGLHKVLAEAPTTTTFIIENTAGAGGTIGRTLEEIEMIVEKIWPKHTNLGICIDTCHAFASGIPIHTPEGWAQFRDEFVRRFGLEALKCVHLNDSKGDFASNKDRHENIGDGKIGYDGFAHIVTDPALQNTPLVMEVPGVEDKGPDAENLRRVKQLLLLQ